ncbi:DUF445 domain-containing protein [Bergeyella zoohelcum]|uniref:DUF445 domain-containing protein n=1 Tax=Bergeyella zoohelcum TaxID=1015 RepID=UPI002A91828C|nr:DUF445 domain-containing protein [Bergeyella zoohelcum]MDY6026339.1 DUF445 domain-containing protein [Bergeyella zoohelcum]
MTEQQKKQQLRKYQFFATGLFTLMAVIFIVMTVLQKTNNAPWIGFVRAFSEAAMVGALADWFAVTALFHYPLGLKIPHTNLIQNKKDQIGDNLGNFVVENFLSPQSIRPFIVQLKVSAGIGEWLAKKQNQKILVEQISDIALGIVQKLEDEIVLKVIHAKAEEMIAELKMNTIVGNGLDYALQKNMHQKFITTLAKEIKNYISNHQEIIQERVQKESFSIIPKFVDDAIAGKITRGLMQYFEEVEQNAYHDLRREIPHQLQTFIAEVKTNEKWQMEFEKAKKEILKSDTMALYAKDIWQSLKRTLMEALESENSLLKTYLLKNLSSFSEQLQTNAQLQHKIDHWVRVTAYKTILKNRHRFGTLISSTVGNWEGKELSNKLELEVGKDLQFIRINGTIVGGLVGLIIYTIVYYCS